MVLHLAHLGARRQQLVEMTASPRRVLALAIATRRRPVEHGLYTAAQPRRRFWLLRPKWLYDFHHESRVGVLDRKGADDRFGIGLDGGAPLRCMPGVAPAGAIGRDVLLGTLLERQRFGSVERGLGALSPGSLDRVYALVGEPPALCGLSPSPPPPNVESEPRPISRVVPRSAKR
jgi:hypothetical protein